MKKREVGKKSKIRVIKQYFNIDNDTRTVTCVLKCRLIILDNVLQYYLDPAMWKKVFPNVGWTLDFTVSARSRCHKEDSFNEKIGKSISRCRAKVKMFNKAKNILAIASMCTNDLSFKYSIEADKYSKLKYRELKYLNGIIK